MWLSHLTVLFIFLLFQWKVSEADKTVETRLYSKWTSTPLLAEISELVANDNKANFWLFAEKLHEHVDSDSGELCSGKMCTEQFHYNIGVAVAEGIVNSTEMDLLRLSLSMRIMSPRVEVHHQLGAASRPDTCEAFFEFRNQKGCHLSALNLENEDGAELRTFPFDHIFPVNSLAPKTLVIYGTLGSDQLRLLIDGAKRLVESNKEFRFVVRHLKASHDGSLVSLSGYGVELALKNTEYKAHDTEKTGEAPEDLHGFNFKRLREQHKNLEKELESLRDHLQNMGEIVPLKSWQLHDLGIQTCQKMANDPDLGEMEKLLQDFPLHARAVSHTTVDEKLRKSVKKHQERLKKRDIEAGMNVLAINGRVIATGNEFIDVYSLIETMKQEQKAVDEMGNLGFKPETDFSRVLTLVDNSPIAASNHAFDYRETLPAYLNDLEASRGRYNSLELILQPFTPGQIRPISRNIFTLVLFSDPFDADDKVFEKIQILFRGGVFIRFGVVPVFDGKKHGMTVEEAVGSRRVAEGKRSLWPTRTSLLSAIQRGNRFVRSTGLTKTPFALLNGYLLDVADAENFESALDASVSWQTTRLQYAVFQGRVNDEMRISDWWLNAETNSDIVERVNQRITSAFNEGKYVNDNSDTTAELFNTVSYFSEKLEVVSKNAVVNTWIVADFENPVHQKFAADVLRSVAVKNNNKVAFIPNSEDVVKACLQGSVTRFLERAGGIEEVLKVLESGAVPEERSLQEAESIFCSTKSFVSTLTGLDPNELAVISNGLIIGPLSEDELLTAGDFEYLEDVWEGRHANKVMEVLNQEIGNDVSVRFYSALSKFRDHKTVAMSFGRFKDPENSNLVTVSPEDPTSPASTVTWISNPVSREAQQIITLLKLIGNTINARIEALSEMPVKRFYRFVASNDLSFDGNGSVQSHSSLFVGLPQKQLLTMSLETNEAWMIEVKQVEYDLDNIVLDTTASNVEGVFSLEHILLEGQSVTPSGSASDGVEVELQSGTKLYDTIVMLNLGYFQLKSEPGVWSLHLRDGSSAEKHRITHADSKPLIGTEIEVVMDSLTGKWIKLVVAEREDTKEPDLSKLEKLMETAKSFFSTSSEQSEVINVFSLASGHLYERFMRIMMVSVMKNTKSQKVKFWLLKNYLSPKFKETIPSLAKFYGFDYELVEYKWPKWLHRQTEKQRVMWGYKILFLDVLFPLNVDKIIFVDADQVVRADLQELMDFNLRGAPYGYVPFCESRQEMDGFRFWKSGYWKQHLAGKRYHISALYVVDLKKFRLFAAGDRLRGRYSALSVDPDSLSNLDQDLPNNMIHEVPIHTLPQEWLWCETWCDDNSKKNAKTIDLCNNPLTKEPKLNSAQRIIGEWRELDDEINGVIVKKEQPNEQPKTEL